MTFVFSGVQYSVLTFVQHHSHIHALRHPLNPHFRFVINDYIHVNHLTNVGVVSLVVHLPNHVIFVLELCQSVLNIATTSEK